MNNVKGEGLPTQGNHPTGALPTPRHSAKKISENRTAHTSLSRLAGDLHPQWIPYDIGERSKNSGESQNTWIRR